MQVCSSASLVARVFGIVGLLLVPMATAQDGVAPAVYDSPGAPDVIPDGGSYHGGGQSYSKALDTVLRVRYGTKSYGQEAGNLDLGTFKAFPMGDDALTFFDGQVVLNDKQGVGYNVGGGIRFLSETMFSPDPTRITGISVWADGTSTQADNFFAQVGVSWESLGDLWDFRANGYAPVGDRFETGEFSGTGSTNFTGNSLGEITAASFDTAFFAAEVEAARRLGNRDAWGFAGVYGLNSGNDETAGYRLGLRGYAVPDVLLQLAVTDDDIFKTNASFSLTWFVGRTRSDYCATCSVLDRFREPVMRNDYVAIQTTAVSGVNTLTDTDGNTVRIVHVDSTAPAGGDGTFENPLNGMDEILGNSQDGDVVLVHADSAFTGDAAVLRDNQRLLGEGEGMMFTINTNESGTITIPETAPGAQNGTKPAINSAPGSAITLADNNEVANFLIEGNNVTVTGVNGMDADGATDPNLHDLMIQNTTGDGIALRAGARVDTADADNDGNTTETRVPFAATLDNIMFDTIAGNDITLDGQAMDGGGAVDVDDADVELVGDVTISNIMSTGNGGTSLVVTNTDEADGSGKVNISNYEYDGGATSAGGMAFTDIDSELIIMNYTANNGNGPAAAFTNLTSEAVVNIDGMTYDGAAGTSSGLVFDNVDSLIGTAGVTVTNSTFTGGMGNGVSILNDSDGMFSFNNNSSFTNIGGTTIFVDGNSGGGGTEFTGNLSVNADITNDTGNSVVLQNMNDNEADGIFSAIFGGSITDTGLGIRVNDNTGAQTSLFAGMVDLDTGASEAVVLNNNGNSEIDFAGQLEIDTDGARGFVSTNGGSLNVSNTNNRITTNAATALTITDSTVNNGVQFGEVNVTANGGNAANGIILTNNDGGNIQVGATGATAGAGGTIASTTGDAVVITDSESVTLNGLDINNTPGNKAAVNITDSAGGDMTVAINDVDANLGDRGLDVNGGGAGAFDLDVNNSLFTNNADIAADFNNVDNGTVDFTNTDIDAGNQATTAGIRILNSDATFTFDGQSSIDNVQGTALHVMNGQATVSHQGDIMNTANDSILVEGVSGNASISATGAVTDTGTGVTVRNNTGGIINMLGTYDLDTGADDAFSITNNTGADVSAAGLDINTTSGNGFVATGGGDLTVNGTTNTITTTTGTAINIDGMNVVAQANFAEINVNGATNGVVLNDVTGALVSVGDAFGGPGSGGTLNTTGTAISIQDTQIVQVNNIEITNAGDRGVEIIHTAIDGNSMDARLTSVNVQASTNESVFVDAGTNVNIVSLLSMTTAGEVDINTSNDASLDVTMNGLTVNSNVNMNIDGSGEFDLRATNIDVTTGNDDVAFLLDLDTSVTSADVLFESSGAGTSTFTTGDNEALLVNSDAATVRFELNDVTFNNSSATDRTTNINITDGQFSSTVLDNTFTNSLAGGEFRMNAEGVTANALLNLDNNTASAGGGDFLLREAGGADFDVQDRDDVAANNNGTVTFDPAIGNFDSITGPIDRPTF